MARLVSICLNALHYVIGFALGILPAGNNRHDGLVELFILSLAGSDLIDAQAFDEVFNAAGRVFNRGPDPADHILSSVSDAGKFIGKPLKIAFKRTETELSGCP